MYDELIKDLREEAEWAEANEWETPIMLSDHLKQAADAIEKMTEDNNALNGTITNLLEQIKDLGKPRWIPVAERLPVEKINPNTQDFEYVLCVTIWGDVRPFKYGTPIGHREAHFWNGAGYVDAYVTHWQSLPTPPKEE